MRLCRLPITLAIFLLTERIKANIIKKVIVKHTTPKRNVGE